MGLFKSKQLKIDSLNRINNGSLLPPTVNILDNITNGFFIVDQDWTISYLNKSMENWVQRRKEDLIGYNLWESLPESINTKFYTNYHKAMEEQVSITFEEYYEPTNEWLEVRLFPSDSDLIGYVNNVSERKNYEKTIEHMAYHDYLTDLPNRRCFEQKLCEQLREAHQKQYSFAIITLDLDRFKYITDTLGYIIGDQLIKQFSTRLIQHIGQKGFVSHVGGIQFTIMLHEQFNDIQSVGIIAQEIIKTIEEYPFYLNDNQLYLICSLGICFYPQHGKDASSLLKNANIALNSAKQKSINRYEFFNPVMDIEAFKKFSLEKDLRKAIEENHLEVYYQPRVCAKTGRILSAEALVRWNHSEWGMVAPADFIPLAEETGLIAPLSEWVERAVCSQLKSWQEQGISLVPISINVSAHRFLSKNFISTIKKTLEQTQLEGKWLEMEITETSILDNQELVDSTITEIKKLGIKISLDDFGTGYSSLAYLTRFKVDVLKIDKSFIRDVTINQANATVVKTIIHLAHGLGMRVVAEGVETKEQLTFVKQQNCDEVQGYLFSKPIVFEDFLRLLANRIITPVKGSPLMGFENKRRYSRVALFFPLSSQMTIIRIKDHAISLGSTEVLIEDIGIGGLRFLSYLSLAIDADIVFEMETEILGELIKVSGSIVWQQEIENGIYQYGLEFTIHEKERDRLAPLLNKLDMQINKNPLVPNCRFVKMDRINYIKNIVTKK
ncbi:EAL domain-containing protein [Paenibacillus sp. CGMCC 1.16610]|uniref:EAL domain-containing protein n=1 Tax=Paenibacillus anseongense TaxID=2682845 RepID=A0ABW9U713_9BACL|nr:MULTISPECIES: GGDEF domain-containing phosphodiesterase [Paenibacillus]MBA2939086.1 EAL domain-containing protein [Paenibacillus sp. CGMCC 1.16610]MVQ35045.1 EAL domain-containing protein [Paenibacillus anseongense]